ncbi:MAG: S8 family serine peptidase [Chlorobi bacterium]|nr:S8 family serine peptidase [Chlorobiota bacterium]
MIKSTVNNILRRIKYVTGIGGIFFSLYLYGQVTEDAWVFFRDKPGAGYYLSHPHAMLSQRALDRRARYGIPLDSTDVPVDEEYTALVAATPGITVMARSKWLNMLHVQGAEADIRALLAFSFVDSIRFANRRLGTVTRPAPKPDKWWRYVLRAPAGDYGNDTVPYAMHHGYDLHAEGYTGRGILIAILDAGFPRADTARIFRHIYQRGGVKDTYNFPDDTAWVYTRHWHGTTVWSVMGGLEDGQLVGTAYNADYCLYISEDTGQEMPVEESWWVMAAERADSVGADVINSSLGYIDFDRSEYDHTRDELGRNIAIVSRGASMAVRKGIRVVISAGNSGSQAWQKVGFPADSPDVIAVGALWADSTRASFSSMGPDALGRIKPDVMSWGARVKVYFSGRYYYLSGTSFASPLMAGFTADMVQAYPFLTPAEYKRFLLASSDRYQHPDTLYGYGIPDFRKMLNMLDSAGRHALEHVRLYPNPAGDYIYINGLPGPFGYRVYNLRGQFLFEAENRRLVPVKYLTKGIYLIQIRYENKAGWFKFVKL